MTPRVRAAAVVVMLGAFACGGEDPTAPDTATSSCSVVGQNTFVRDTLREDYFWYRELPDLSPSSFTSPDAYLEAVRYRRFDTSFSYVADKAASAAFFSDSQFIGFGFRSVLLAADDLRAADVYAGSPAAEAGLQRGARFLAVDGKTIAQLVASGELGGAFGAGEVGVTAQVRFLDRDGRERDVRLVKRAVTIPTVAVVRTYRVADRTVGYILFENFVTPSNDALDAAFTRLRADGVQELVLDMRYNGGGLASVARHLAGLIGGARTSGQPFVRFVHNDKNSRRDSTLDFPSPAQALGLSRLVVIATQSSASASELVINGLRPFMEVAVVGERTYGKPVGQYGFDFCDKTLFPVAFATLNARNEGDYFDGIPASCAAADDLSRDLGDPEEASLAESLQFVRTGRCSGGAAAAAHAQSLRRPPAERQPHREDGWQSLVGSY